MSIEEDVNSIRHFMAMVRNAIQLTTVQGRLVNTEAIAAKAMNTQAQSIDSATLTPLTYDTELLDTDGLWDAGAPTRFTARRSGIYAAGGAWTLAAAQNTADSRMAIFVRLNGVTYIDDRDARTVANKLATVIVSSGPFRMSEGDYIELVAYHDEGTTKTTTPSTTTDQHKHNGWLRRLA